MVFGHLVAGVLPMLLELGARAAKGHEPSADLARQVLRTLAEAGGPSLHRPRAPTPRPPSRPGWGSSSRRSPPSWTWAVGPDWPPDDELGGRSGQQSAQLTAPSVGSLTRGVRSAYIW